MYREILPASKYTNWYLNIIEAAKTRTIKPEEYYEKHHILPKSLFPEYKTSEWNIIKLTPREHFITHVILIFIYKSDKNKKHRMSAALSRFRSSSSRLYDRFIKITRQEHSEFMKESWCNFSDDERNTRLANFKCKRTDEWKRKISASRKGKYTGSENPFFGQTHTEETRKHLKDNHWSTKGIEVWNKGKKGEQKATDNQKKIAGLTAKKNFSKTKWIHRDGVRRRIKEELLETYINHGWQLGHVIKQPHGLP